MRTHDIHIELTEPVPSRLMLLNGSDIGADQHSLSGTISSPSFGRLENVLLNHVQGRARRSIFGSGE